MADLSPSAQAVADAYDNTPELPTGNHRYHWLAAALRAAADQVVPERSEPLWGTDTDHTSWYVRNDVREDLLVIAAELEGGHG